MLTILMEKFADKLGHVGNLTQRKVSGGNPRHPLMGFKDCDFQLYQEEEDI